MIRNNLSIHQATIGNLIGDKGKKVSPLSSDKEDEFNQQAS